LSRGPALTYNNSSSNSYVAIFPKDQDKAASKAGSYFQVTVQAKAGYFISLSSIDAILRRASVTSPSTYRWAYSLDGNNFTEVGNEDVFISRTAADNNNGEVQPTIDLGAITALQYVPSNVVITFRLYAWGGTDIVSSSNFGVGKFSATAPSLTFKGLLTSTAPVLHTVTFNSKGGSAVNPINQFHGLKIMSPANPVLANFNFGGWYKDENYITRWDFATDLLEANTTLYAKWVDRTQVINFPAITDKGYGEAPFLLNATVNSGLPITYEALTNNITINGNTVTINNLGLAKIKASQPGNANYDAATPVEVSFNIAKGTQTITFAQPKPISRYADVVALSATSSSGLPVSFACNNTLIATITGDNKLQVKGLGTVKITASQEGNELYLPAILERDVLIHTAGNTQLLVTQALSPNGDGVNDIFIIEGILTYPENQVKIVNRSGALVFEQKGYDNDRVAFSGRSKGGDKLPDGTYYYSIEFKLNGKWEQKKGYLFLKN
ncbi:T9SS type B sorting domain-containing protein, partial [Pedobacter sp.]